MVDEAIGALAEQDLAAFRELLESRRNVCRVTRDEIVVGDEADPCDRPGVNTGPGRRSEAEASFELAIEPSELRPHLDRRPHGAQGIVLVQGRDSEDRKHGVADEFASVPPWRSTIGRIASKYSVMTCESASGSSCSPSEVEPTTSEKRTVTVLRKGSAASAKAAGRPQASQSAPPHGFPRQFGQVSMSRW